MFALIFVAASALILSVIKHCDPARHRSIYFQRKGRRE